MTYFDPRRGRPQQQSPDLAAALAASQAGVTGQPQMPSQQQPPLFSPFPVRPLSGDHGFPAPLGAPTAPMQPPLAAQGFGMGKGRTQRPPRPQRAGPPRFRL